MFNINPRGIRNALINLKEKYENKKIYVLENGFCRKNEAFMEKNDAL